MSIPMGAFSDIGKVLGLVSGGYLCLKVIRGDEEWTSVFEQMAVAVLMSVFFSQFLTSVDEVGGEILRRVQKMGDAQALDRKVMEHILAGYENGNTSVVGGAIFGGAKVALRGVAYGVVATLGNLVFSVSEVIITSAHDVLWILVSLAMPIGAGLYPAFPEILKNLVAYSVELSLWPAVLTLVKIICAAVIDKNLSDTDSVGVAMLATECVAVYLMFSVPSVVHSLVSGALSGDHGASSYATQKSKGAWAYATRVLGTTK